jgi:FAD dependent oxidoreductase TIGR03364
MRIVVIGGGVLGTMHAAELVGRGHRVTQLEREPEARGATVRNFGLVWVSGRSAAEMSITLRARELWERLGADVPGVGFRACGSLTVLRSEAELAVAKQLAAAPDAVERGVSVLDETETRRRNPALRGQFRAALWCSTDAAVESRVALPAVRAHLEPSGRYTFLAGREARQIDTGTGSGDGTATVRDQTGALHEADLVLLCPGATLTGLAAELAGDLPVRRVRLQMMQTAPLGEPLTTAIADGDSMRYYPAFAGPALEQLRAIEPQPPIAAEHHMQLLCVQRLHGGLTIGDTHEYDEPFPFDLDEAPYQHLAGVVEALLGRPLPPVVRRWAGVYAQCLDPTQIVHRQTVDPTLLLVTGPGGRGMTLSPAIAEQTADLAGL